MSTLKKLGTIEEDTPPWLEDRIILTCITGSHSYGTNHEESDTDYCSICIPPKDYFLGLSSFNEYNTTGGKNWRSTKDTKDVRVVHINKLILGCLMNSPNYVELLFLKPELYTYKHPLTEELFAIRNMFVSKLLKERFEAYSATHLQEIYATLQNPGTGRVHLIEKFGYDVKCAAHAIRALYKVVDVLETSKFETFCNQSNIIKDILRGKFTLPEIEKMNKDLRDQIKDLYRESTLPEKPDVKAVNQWLTSFNEKALTMLP